MTAMLWPMSITVPAVVLPGESDPVVELGSTSVMPDPKRSPVYVSVLPAPSVIRRLRPVAFVGICIFAALNVSLNATSNAPCWPLPVFSTMMQNLTRSLPSTFDSVAVIGCSARPVDVTVPVNDAPGTPGWENVTPGGAICGGSSAAFSGWNTPAGLFVETTPLVIPSSGSETFTWARAVLEVRRSPVSFRSCCSA